MPPSIDYTGQIFNKLTAIEFTGKYATSIGGNKKRLWLFQCSCGKQHIAPMEKVKCEDTKSCGCLRGKYSGNESLLYGVFQWGKSKIKSKRTGKLVNCYSDGDLTFEQFKSLIVQNCFWCKRPPSNYVSNRTTKEKIYYQGLDRDDNSRKHDFDNVQPCCHSCNTTKGGRSNAEYIEYLKTTLTHLGYKITKEN